MWWLRLLVLLAALLLAACGGPAKQRETPPGDRPEEPRTEGGGSATAGPDRVYDPGELGGSGWVLSSLRGGDLVEGTRITLRFRQNGLRGNAGCNFYGSTRVRTESGRFDVGPVETTEIGCKGPVGEQESAYLKALQTAGKYHMEGDRLEIRAPSGATLLVFEREA